LITKPLIKKLLSEYIDYDDIPQDIELKIYSLEEIFIEKCLCILDKARNEPRDIYDLWYLVANEYIDVMFQGENIKKKGRYKSINDFNLIAILDAKKNIYSKLWEVRLNNQMIDLPHFEKTYRELRRSLRPLVR